MDKKISDFGIKISGARKNKRSETIENALPKMNNPGNFLLINRDNIWPETNGEELVSSGIPQGIAYWREQIRKTIPPNPVKADERSMINYFNIVSELRDQANQVNAPEDVESFFSFIHEHYLIRSDNQPVHVADPAKDVISRNLLREAQTEYCTYEHNAEKILFGIPKKDRAALRKKRKEIHQDSTGNTNTNSHLLNRKKPFPIPKLSSFTRNGPAHLPPGNHAGKEEFLSLGIQGVEFGLWMSDADAQAALDQCYNALLDLATVLDIAPKDISLGGRLSLSFGARGHGETLADYKANQQLICLPNGNGNGFLAHAWAYALDDYLGQYYGRTLSQMADLALWHPGMDDIPAFVEEFLSCLTWQTITVTAEEQNQLQEQKRQKTIQKYTQDFQEKIQSIAPNLRTKKQQIRWDEAVQEVYDQQYLAKLGMYSEGNDRNPALEKLSAVYKDITGQSIPKRKRASINYSLVFLYAAQKTCQPITKDSKRKIPNNYHDASCKTDHYFSKTAHGEYGDFCERFARAFDSYIADKLRQAGIQNQYLTAHSEAFVFQDESGRIVHAIPMGEERKKMNQKFDELILKMKERGLFHQRIGQNQSLCMNTEKTSIADIRCMVAGQQKKLDFGRKARTNSYYGR